MALQNYHCAKTNYFNYFKWCASKFGHSLTSIKIWGRSTPYGPRHDFPKKSTLLGPNSGKNAVVVTLSNFRHLYPFRRYSPSKFEVVWNHDKFCMFLASIF